MTEAEWLASGDIDHMLGWVSWNCDERPRPSNHRGLRLFACGCVRAAREPFTNDQLRKAVELVEGFADSRTNEQRNQIKAARQISRALFQVEYRIERGIHIDPPTASYFLLDALVRVSASDAAYETHHRCRQYDQEAGRSVAASYETRRRLLIDIFGNSFRRMILKPRWRTADVLGLARGIYEDRAFDRLPLLADALMDAGCADEAVLAHCRGDGPHVRGCWVVDLVLDKE